MKAVLLAIAAAGVSAGVLTDSQHQYLFTSFASSHGKQYEMKEYFNRFNTFKNNLEMIVNHNAKAGITHTMAVNQFADMTNEEFAARNNLKVQGGSLRAMAARSFVPKANLPESVDWTTKKNANGVAIIGKVEDQGSCGSCWAFSTAGTIEANYVLNGATEYKKTSEQQLVDCAGGKYGNEGCNGGLMDLAIDYLKDNGAVYLKDYPYTARDGSCQASGKDIAIPASAFSYSIIPADKTGENMKSALVDTPLAIALAASSADFQFYKSGVITSSSCGTQPNHALVATGYGNLNGVEYINIRNSWGASWGDNGYVKIGAQGNICGLTGHNWNVKPNVKA